MGFVVMPQATRIIIPPLGNSVNGLLKTTSVTSVISMEELLRRTQILIQEKFLVLELFAVAALYYLLDDHALGHRPAPHRGPLRQGLQQGPGARGLLIRPRRR